MLKIGCHLSISKGFYEMGKEAVSINANTIQFFTRNPRGGAAKEIDEEDVKKFKVTSQTKQNRKLISTCTIYTKRSSCKARAKKVCKRNDDR